MKTKENFLRVLLVIVTGLFLSTVFSQDQTAPDAVSEPPAIPQPEQPANLTEKESIASEAKSPSPRMDILILSGILVFLSLATFALALYSVRLTRLRLKSGASTVINFGDSVGEWMKDLEKHWNHSHQTSAENASKTLAQLQEVGTAIDAKGQEQSKQLADAFKKHHNIVGTELNSMSSSLAEMREILATVRKVAEEKKEELEEYKAGYRVSMSKDALGHLCDVREHLLKVHAMLAKNPSEASSAIEALSNIDWELSDTLDNLDLVEIEAKRGMSIRDESLSGKHKVLGTKDAPSPEYHGIIDEIISRGYLIRIPKANGEETLLFRPVQVTVFADPNLSRGNQPSQTNPNEAPTQPDKPA